MPGVPLTPAQLAFTSDGTPYSETFDDVYHSAGGVEQARAVFLAGNHLPERWRGRGRFVILETGFGIGLNFLATWRAWREDQDRPERLHFISVEKHPLTAGDLARAHRRLPQYATLSAELSRIWPLLVPGFHRLHFEGERVTLTLLFGEALDCLRKLEAGVDAFYLDGFSPAKNPAMWSEQVFRAAARLARSEATLATWTVASAVRERLAAAGFATEKRPGFGFKREMLIGRYAPPRYRKDRLSPSPALRHAIVIGAGLAGTAASERLAARGWEVELVERHAAPAGEASGMLASIFRPVLSKDDNLSARLSRAAMLYALRRFGAIAAAGLPLCWSSCGVLQIARNATHEQLQQATLEQLGFPPEFVSFLSVEAATRLVGRPVANGGWLFPGGGWINPPSLCRTQLDSKRIRTHYAREALSIERQGQAWRVRDGADETLAQAPVLVLANGVHAPALSRMLPLKRIRGQVTYVPAGALPSLPVVVCREGYITPAVQGFNCVGATYDFDDDPTVRASGHEGNLERLERMLPGACAGVDRAALTGRVGFRAATRDRLPLVGAVANPDALRELRDAQLASFPRQSGLYGLLGFGSRGLIWAALAAELLGSQLEGDPLPVESDLVAAVDPARFLLRAYRRGWLPPVRRIPRNRD